ncbi:MAG: hypothetical protein Q4F02_01535 [Candidatus Saccharibacteria bacterium]|nr:hypothetical protein [Candidatus Saccharibacteria bacterium]
MAKNKLYSEPAQSLGNWFAARRSRKSSEQESSRKRSIRERIGQRAVGAALASRAGLTWVGNRATKAFGAAGRGFSAAKEFAYDKPGRFIGSWFASRGLQRSGETSEEYRSRMERRGKMLTGAVYVSLGAIAVSKVIGMMTGMSGGGSHTSEFASMTTTPTASEGLAPVEPLPPVDTQVGLDAAGSGVDVQNDVVSAPVDSGIDLSSSVEIDKNIHGPEHVIQDVLDKNPEEADKVFAQLMDELGSEGILQNEEGEPVQLVEYDKIGWGFSGEGSETVSLSDEAQEFLGGSVAEGDVDGRAIDVAADAALPETGAVDAAPYDVASEPAILEYGGTGSTVSIDASGAYSFGYTTSPEELMGQIVKHEFNKELSDGEVHRLINDLYRATDGKLFEGVTTMRVGAGNVWIMEAGGTTNGLTAQAKGALEELASQNWRS